MHSRRRYDAGYGVKSRADMHDVLEFFEERRGRFHAFLWRDALDYTSANDGGGISSNDQPLGTGDGTTTEFALIKRYGGSFDPYDRPITKPQVLSVLVALDGAPISASDYDVNGLTGVLTFDTAPPGSSVVTAGFEFDVPVRFDIDHLDIELTSFDAAAAPNIPVVEVIE
jgi:uncharacterized protein (TIGR02217 family)